jgi:hypothetical protein
MKYSPLLRFCLVLAAFAAASAACGSQNHLALPDVAADPTANRVLADSCYHCHSSEEADLWYAKLRPSRWLGNNPAVEQLDFSQWNSYDAQRKEDAVRQIAAAVAAGTMPPRGYLLFHPQARLSAEQKDAIARWAAVAGAVPKH